MKLTTLNALLIEELRSLYEGELQILRAQPKLTKIATAPALREEFKELLHQGQSHIHRLEQIFSKLGAGPKGANGRAIETLIAETRDLMGSDAEPSVMDAALIVAVQRVGHYQIASCAGAGRLARQTEQDKLAAVLQEMLEEKTAADSRLADVAEKLVCTPAKC